MRDRGMGRVPSPYPCMESREEGARGAEVGAYRIRPPVSPEASGGVEVRRVHPLRPLVRASRLRQEVGCGRIWRQRRSGHEVEDGEAGAGVVQACHGIGIVGVARAEGAVA